MVTHVVTMVLCDADSKGSSGLQSIDTDDTAVISVSFAWGCGQNAVLALKLNCLSTEFAVKKHGGFVSCLVPGSPGCSVETEGRARSLIHVVDKSP